jgi:hypothetical protein
MPVLTSTIRPAPGGNGGPFFVVTEKDGAVTKVTTGVASLAASLDQAKADQGPLIGADTFVATVARTTTTP